MSFCPQQLLTAYVSSWRRGTFLVSCLMHPQLFTRNVSETDFKRVHADFKKAMATVCSRPSSAVTFAAFCAYDSGKGQQKQKGGAEITFQFSTARISNQSNCPPTEKGQRNTVLLGKEKDKRTFLDYIIQNIKHTLSLLEYCSSGFPV